MNKAFKIILIPFIALLIWCGFADLTYAGAEHNVSGFAWSDNIGWISFNNFSDGSAINYGVNIDLNTGILSGYAWSDNVGWISFNESEVKVVDNAVEGRARALAYGDGWDGWIKFDHGMVDETYIDADGAWQGWAWGSEVIGWISFYDVVFSTAPLEPAPPLPTPPSPPPPPDEPPPENGGTGGGTGADPAELSVSLLANPLSGESPLNDVDLTASVSGTAAGTINYTFYCDRDDDGINITAPDPCPEEYTSDGVVIYETALSYNGNFGGRTGADSFCQTNIPDGLTCDNVHAFVSVSSSDEVRDMPSRYGYQASAPLYWYHSVEKYLTKFANDWADMLDGSIEVSARTGTGIYGDYWTGSYVDGSNEESRDPGYGNCRGWRADTRSYYGTVGNSSATNAWWLWTSEKYSCPNKHKLLCVCGSVPFCDWPDYDHKIDSTNENPYTIADICDYSEDGVYTAKVIVERDSLAAEDRQTIVVGAAVLPPNNPPAVLGLSTNASDVDYCSDTPAYIVLNWRFSDQDSGDSQSAYQLRITRKSDSQVYDSGKVSGSAQSMTALGINQAVGSNFIWYDESQSGYEWKVQVWDSSDSSSGWASGPSFNTPKYRYPLIDFNWAPQEPSGLENVLFADQSVAYGGATKSTWLWMFEDGNPGTSSEQNPIAQFTSYGSKQVTLKLTCSDGIICSFSKTVDVLESLPFWREILPW